eukprot:CAMPEP_0194026828 /NCGR_PEP_ID=MMETSP0009_2-20130614/1090_1 /TAXON_ID=210454 /ORGANISM="Grammatophora oceanica, Strain CCMP 410" /LENGTH=55 /DNA_ID=CAMNT_0038665693 /DNA_START=65 /DNA_END=229 /DNA_ORIENTATION=+
MVILPPEEMEDHEACPRKLRAFFLQGNADIALVRSVSMLELCQTIQGKLKRTWEM